MLCIYTLNVPWLSLKSNTRPQWLSLTQHDSAWLSAFSAGRRRKTARHGPGSNHLRPSFAMGNPLCWKNCQRKFGWVFSWEMRETIVFYHETELKSQFLHFNLQLKSRKSIVIICSIHENNLLRFLLKYVTTEKPLLLPWKMRSSLSSFPSILGSLDPRLRVGCLWLNIHELRNGWNSPWILWLLVQNHQKQIKYDPWSKIIRIH